MNRAHPSALLKSLVLIHFQQNQVQTPPQTWTALHLRSPQGFLVHLPPLPPSYTSELTSKYHHLANKPCTHALVCIFHTHCCFYLEGSSPRSLKGFLLVTATCCNKLSPLPSSTLVKTDCPPLCAPKYALQKSLSIYRIRQCAYMSVYPTSVWHKVLLDSAIPGPGTKCFTNEQSPREICNNGKGLPFLRD